MNSSSNPPSCCSLISVLTIRRVGFFVCLLLLIPSYRFGKLFSFFVFCLITVFTGTFLICFTSSLSRQSFLLFDGWAFQFAFYLLLPAHRFGSLFCFYLFSCPVPFLLLLQCPDWPVWGPSLPLPLLSVHLSITLCSCISMFHFSPSVGSSTSLSGDLLLFSPSSALLHSSSVHCFHPVLLKLEVGQCASPLVELNQAIPY